MNKKERIIKTLVFISLFVGAIFMSLTQLSAKNKDITIRNIEFSPDGGVYAVLNDAMVDLSIYDLPEAICANEDSIKLAFGVRNIWNDRGGSFGGEGVKVINDTSYFFPTLVSESFLDKTIEIVYHYSDGVNTFRQNVTVHSVPDIRIEGDYTKNAGVCNSTQLRGELLTNHNRVTDYAWTQDEQLYTADFPPAPASYLSETNVLNTTFTYEGDATANEVFVYYLVAEDELGCRDTASTKINVNIISADAGAATRKVGTCTGSQLDGSGSEGYDLAYSWSSAPANLFSTSSSIVNPTTTALTSNTEYTLTVTDAFGCTDNASTVLQPTELQISAGENKSVTVCDNIVLSGTATGGAGLSARWEQISGPTVTISKPNNLSQSIKNNGAGIYRFRLNGSDAYSCSSNDEVEVTVRDVQLDIASDVTKIGACKTALLYVVSKDNATVSWSPANRLSSSTGDTVVFSPLDTDYGKSVEVIASITVDGCTVTEKQSIIVAEAPYVQVEAMNGAFDRSPCSIDTLGAYDSRGEDLSYKWSPSGQITPVQTNPRLAYFKANKDMTYNVTVTDRYGCSAGASIDIESLNVNAGGDITVPYCEDIQLSGSADNGILSVEWFGTDALSSNTDLNATLDASVWDNIPDGQTSSTLNLVLVGTTAENCLVSDTVVVTALKPEARYVIGDNSISSCGGSFGGVLFGDNISLEWHDTKYFDTPADIHNLNPSLTPSESAVGTSQYYSYSLTDENGCVRDDSVLVEFEAGSDIVISGAETQWALPNELFVISDISVSNGSGSYLYSWSPAIIFEDSSVLNAAIWNMEDGESHVVTLEVTDQVSGCTGSKTIEVFASSKFRITSLTQDKKIGCVGEDVTFDLTVFGGDPSAYSFKWYRIDNPEPNVDITLLPKGNVIATTEDITVDITEGLAVYIVDVNDGNTFDQGYANVSSSGITANAGNDIVIGACQTATLDASSSKGEGLVYNWTPTTGLVGDTNSEIALYKGESTQIELLVEDKYGCTVTDDVSISVGEPIEAIILSTPTLDACDKVNLIAAESKGEELSYNWSSTTGLLTPDYLSGTQFTPANGGEHTIKLTLEDKYGCTETEIVTLTADYMVIDAGEDAYIESGETAPLVGSVTSNNMAFPLDFLWLPAEMVESSQELTTKSLPMSQSGRFVLKVEDNNGCVAYDDKYVNVQGGELTVEIAGNDAPVCPGGFVQLYALVTGGSGPYTYLWKDATGNDLNNSVSVGVDVAEETAIFLTVTDATSNVTASTVIKIGEEEPPVVNFSGGGTYYAGQVSPSLILSNTETDVIYGLIHNGVPIDTLTGTGADKIWASPDDGAYQIFAVRQGLCDNVVTRSDIITVEELELSDVVIDAFVVSNSGATTVCKGSTISFEYTISGGLADNYDITWYLDGEIAESGPGVQLFEVQQSGSYKLSVTDGFSTDEETIEITISDVVANAGDDIFIGSCKTANLNGSASVGNIATYSWESNDGDNLGGNATAEYSGESTSIKLTVTDAYGCSSVDEVNVTFADAPKAVVVDTIQVGCAEKTIDASNSIGEELTYQWWAPEGKVAPVNLPATSFSANNGGVSSLYLSVTDKYGCTDEKEIVAVSSRILIDAGADKSIRPGETVFLSGTVIGGNSYMAYSWDPEVNLEKPNSLDTYSGEITTTTKFTLTGNDKESCSSSDEMMVYVVGDNLTATIVGGDDEVCVPASTTLFALPDGGNGTYNYSWRNSAGDVLGTDAVYVLFTTEDFEITLNISSGSDIVSTSKTIKVSDYKVDSIVLFGGGEYISSTYVPPVVIAGSKLGTKYAILRDDYPIDTVSGTGDDYYYNTPGEGTYQVYSYIEGICGYGTSNEVEVEKIEVNEVTIAALSSSSSFLCAASDVQLNADVVGGDETSYLYQWSTNGKIVSSNKMPSLTISETGYYVLYVTDGYTEAKDSVQVVVSNIKANLGNNIRIGTCQTVQLDATNSIGEGLTYSWGSVEGLVESNTSGIASYSGPSTAVSITVEDINGCIATDEVMIEVAEKVEAITDKKVTVDGCSGVELNGSTSTGSQLTYTWLPQDGTVETTYLSTAYFTPSNGGETIVLFEVEDQFGCSDTDTIIVEANFVSVYAGDDAYISSGESASLTGDVSNTGNEYTYSWSPSDKVSNHKDLVTSTLPMTESEVFTLSVKDTASGCIASDEKTVYVTGGTIAVEIGGYYGPVCFGSTTELEAIINGGESVNETSGYNISWYNSEGNLLGDDASLVIAPKESTFIRLEVHGGTSSVIYSDTLTVKIENSQLQEYDLVGGGDYYYDTNIPSITLTGSEEEVGYILIQDGLAIDTIFGTGEIIEWESPAEGDYQVIGIKEGSCSTFMSGYVTIRKVEVEPLKIIEFTVGNDTICAGASIELSVEVTGGDKNRYSYVWQTDEGYLSSLQTVNINISKNTTFKVEVSDGISVVDTSIAIVVSSPMADAGADAFISNCTSATLIGSGSKGDQLSYMWEAVDGITGSRTNDTISYQGSATAIALTVIDRFGCIATDEVNVYVSESVKAVVSDTVYAASCNGVKLDASSSKGSELSFAWLPLNGDVTTPLFATTDYTANNGGESEVVITVTDKFGCSDDDTVLVVTNLMEVDAGVEEYLTTGASATLSGEVTGGGSNLSYNWTPEDLATDPTGLSTTSVALSSTTIFTLAVSDQDNGCNASDRKWANVTGGDMSVSIAGNNSDVCPGETVVLDALVNGGEGNYTYRWVDKEGTLLGDKQTVVVNPMDTLRVSLMVTDANLASAEGTTQINVKGSTIGDANLVGGGYYCVIDESPVVELSTSEEDVQYILLLNGSPIDTVAGTGNSIEWNDLADGDYAVMAYKLGECLVPMTGSVSVAFVDIEKLNVNLQATNNGIYCIGSDNEMLLWLDTTSTKVIYDLILNDVIINSQLGNGDSLSWLAQTDGMYSINATLLGEDACRNVSTDNIVVQGYGDPALENDTAFIPEGATITQVRLDVIYGTGHYSYKWMPSNKFEINTVAQPVLVDYTSGETYTVEIIDLLSGCSSVEEFTVVTIKPLNYLGINILDSEVCKGEAAKVLVNTEYGDLNNLMYVWQAAEHTDTVYTSMYRPVPYQNTSYSLLEVSDGYDSYYPNETFDVTINPSGVVDERSEYFCKGGEALTLTPEWTNKVDDWNWYDINSTQLSVLKSLSLEVETASEFIAVGINEYGCLDSVRFMVEPIEEPVAISDTIYLNKSKIEKGEIEKSVGIYVGDNDIVNDDYYYDLLTPALSFADVELTDSYDGKFNYRITKDHFNYAGKDSFKYIIKSDVCTDVERVGKVLVVHANKLDIFAPVGFSPNNDGVNDYLEFEGLENYDSFKLYIFNRWGSKVFEASAPDRIWDGKANVSSIVTIGEDLPDGTYYYIIETKDEGKITGFVELMR